MTTEMTNPDAETLKRLAYQADIKNTQTFPLTEDTRYAVCLIRLNPSVVRGDYPALKTAIEGVTGVDEITLISDRLTRAAVDMPPSSDPGTLKVVELGIVNCNIKTTEVAV